MSIYKLSYQNLRRNWWRNTTTLLRIIFGVIILLILISSGIGITTVLGQNQSLNGSQPGQNSKINIINTLNDIVNNILGSNLSNSQLINGLKKILNGIISFIDLIASLIFLVGVFGINFAMEMNLRERKRELNILKTLGFTETEIILTHLLEAGLIGFIGAVIGAILVIIGLVILSDIVKIQLFNIVMPLWLPFTVILLTTVLSMIIVAFTVWIHVTEDPVEGLRI